MKSVAVVLAAAVIAAAVAECPNACSGHGSCGENDACKCFDNWMGGDCSQRVCPYGLSFVDTPLGDLNHDGAVAYDADGTPGADLVKTGQSNKEVNEVWNGAHAYTECSGKGFCNRAGGECECFDGYTGSACQRTTCPNDCSGHGQCYTLREIAAGDNRDSNTKGRNFREVSFEFGKQVLSGVDTKFDYNLWDADKNQACVCDPGFFGPDCSMRECPRGNDPLTTKQKFCGGATCQSETQFAIVSFNDAALTSVMQFEWTPADNYNGLLNKIRSRRFSLKPEMSGDDYAELVQEVLHTFPENALGGVKVTCVKSITEQDMTVGGNTKDVECDVPVTLVAPDDEGAVLLKIDFSEGPQGDLGALIPTVWEIDGSKTTSTGFLASTFISVIQAGGADQLPTASTGLIERGGSLTVTGTAAAAVVNDIETRLGSFTPGNGNNENAPCSNRGLCDYSAGQCQCFAGYTREDCSVQAALAM